MRRRSTPNPWFLALVAFATCTAWLGCGGDEFTAGEPSGVGGAEAGGAGGQAGHAGANTGGTAGANGGAAGQAGSPSGGAAGQAGSPNGGAAGQAGSPNGGAAGEAGAATGGTAGEAGSATGGSSGEAGVGGQAGAGGTLPEASACPDGQQPCDGVCVDLTIDPAHCGACDHDCTGFFPHAKTTCSNGACIMGTCETGWGDCDDNAPGCETELLSNEQNCGECGIVCSNVNSTSTCDQGQCVLSCTPPFLNCDANPGNGCEANGAADALHCGSCAGACSSSHAVAIVCEASACSQSCEVGWLDCGETGTIDNGCELAESTLNCGACGGTCGMGAVCTGSICLCDPAKPVLGCGPGSCESDGTCSCPTFNLVMQCKRGERCVPNDGGVGGGAGMYGAGGAGGSEYEMQGVAGIGVGGVGGGMSDTGHCSCPANVDGKGSPCEMGLACCTTGCQNLAEDPKHCGNCGHRCPPGFACTTGKCQCDADADCNAGTPGKCVSNACVCDAATCVKGKRCLSNGTCG